MKIAKKLAIGALAATLTLTTAGLAACGDKNDSKPKTYPTEITNGGFEVIGEENTWKGWTRSGTAFQVSGIVDHADNTVVDKTGDKFFYGLEGGTSAMTGTLTSDPFKLTGTGKIAFKMGAGKDGGKVYVEFYEVGKKAPLLKVSNTDFDENYRTDLMVRKIADLSAHVGKNIYIKVTDNDKSPADEYGYVNLDDFVVCATADDVAKYEAERATQLKTYGEPLFTEDASKTTIDNGGFETGDLTNWKILEGKAFTNINVLPTSTRYWTDRPVYGHGEYYIDGLGGGTVAETAKGAIRSQKFTLAGDGYITFMMGAGKSNCYVAICAAEAIEYTVDVDGVPTTKNAAPDDELITVTNDGFVDPARAQMLLRRYVDASKFLGKKLYIKVVDNNIVGDFGFMSVDDFRVSLTEEQVKALQLEQYNAAINETYTGKAYDDIAALQQYYKEYDYLFALEIPLFTNYAANRVVAKSTEPVDLTTMLEGVTAKYGDVTEGIDISISKVSKDGQAVTEGFDAFDLSKDGKYTVTYVATYEGKSTSADFTLLVHSDDKQVANGGFETGDLTGWTVLTEGWSTANGQPTGVINAQTYWGQDLPYNQTGNYHLDGWNNGIEESKSWTVRSTVFTLSGSGWITVKMGGNAAAVKVYKENNTLIGYYKQNRFSDTGFGDKNNPTGTFLKEGGSWADMATYAIDLHDYVGQKLYIELCDEGGGSWAHAFFDEVVTYYETAPNWQDNFETVINAHIDTAPRDETDTVNIAWVKPDNELNQVVFTSTVVNKVVKSSNTALDATSLIADIKAVYGSDKINVTDIKITAIEKKGDTENTVITSAEYTALDISAVGDIYYVTYTGTYNGKSTSKTFSIHVGDDDKQVVNGGFETGDLTGWTVLTDGWAEKEDGSLAGVISAKTYWGEELPYNQSGDYHLDGWDTGIAESSAWTVRSSEFTLSGSGWITVKMGGNAAAVKVYKADGTLIGHYKQSRFSDTNFPHVGQGGSWADMATYAINLSDYIGEKLYIELCDEGGGSWAHAFFDEVVTYYENAPDVANSKDTVKDGHTNAEDAQDIDIPWVAAVNELDKQE